MNKGWECPKCGKVYAPHVDECKACNQPVMGTSSTKIQWGRGDHVIHLPPHSDAIGETFTYNPYRIEYPVPYYPQKFKVE